MAGLEIEQEQEDGEKASWLRSRWERSSRLLRGHGPHKLQDLL